MVVVIACHVSVLVMVDFGRVEVREGVPDGCAAVIARDGSFYLVGGCAGAPGEGWGEEEVFARGFEGKEWWSLCVVFSYLIMVVDV